MAFTLPPLPYAKDALAPTISAETIEYHFGKHHAAYVTKLNDAIAGTPEESKSLVDIIKSAAGGLFNNAAQVWNHTFYWRGLSPDGGGTPSGELAAAIDAAFGSFDAFKSQFEASAVGNFGSGWTWLVKKSDGSLAIVNTDDAANPMTDGDTPLWTADVWEHAYYVDYRNARPGYLTALWGIANWDFAADNFANFDADSFEK